MITLYNICYWLTYTIDRERFVHVLCKDCLVTQRFMCAVKIHTVKPLEPRILFNSELVLPHLVGNNMPVSAASITVVAGLRHYANYLTTAAMRRSTCLSDIPLSSTISIHIREA